MTNAQKAAHLRQAMDLLEQADEMVRRALGDTDAGMDLHHGFDSLIEDLMYDILELEGALE